MLWFQTLICILLLNSSATAYPTVKKCRSIKNDAQPKERDTSSYNAPGTSTNQADTIPPSKPKPDTVDDSSTYANPSTDKLPAMNPVAQQISPTIEPSIQKSPENIVNPAAQTTTSPSPTPVETTASSITTTSATTSSIPTASPTPIRERLTPLTPSLSPDETAAF
jgi:hypothetical protein